MAVEIFHDQIPRKNVLDMGIELGAACMPPASVTINDRCYAPVNVSPRRGAVGLSLGIRFFF